MLKDKNVILTLGMFSLIIAILLGKYVNSSPVTAFLEGLFYGLSIVFNIYSLLLFRKNRKAG